MVKGVGVESMQSKVRQFFVIGRGLPNEKNPNPSIYRMRVFAQNAVLAKSKFWYHMKRNHKVRKIQGEIVSVSEVFEKHPGVLKTYGIVLKYLSRTDPINMYKEFRDTTLAGAVSQMYMEMSGRHRAPHESIQIIKTSIVQPNDLRREHSRAYSKVSVKFPKVKPIKRAPTKNLVTTFKASRPINAQQNSNSLDTTGYSSVIICSKADESRFLKSQEERNRIEKLKQVRKQEKEISRQNRQKQQEKKEWEQQQLELEQKDQQYLRAMQEREELLKLRELEIERTGKAMRDAQEAEERSLREDLEKKEKAIRDERAKKARGKQALDRERELQVEKKELEEQILQLERKKQVQQQEREIAHERATKYRDQEAMKSQITDKQSNISHLERISKFTNKIENSLISKSQIDFTNTRFHNALIVRHDHEQVIQEELKKGAFDLAKDETTKKNIQKAQKENVCRINEQKARERGQKALNAELSKKDKIIYEKEMKKIQQKEGWEKIQNGLKDKTTNYNAAYNEKKEKQKKEKMQNLFEQEFLANQEDAKQPLQEIHVPQPAQRINIRINDNMPDIKSTDQDQINNKNVQNNFNSGQTLQQQINLQFPIVQYTIEAGQYGSNPYSQQNIHQASMNPYINNSEEKNRIDSEDLQDCNSQYRLKSTLDQHQTHQSPYPKNITENSIHSNQDQSLQKMMASSQSKSDTESFYKQQLQQYQQQQQQQQQQQLSYQQQQQQQPQQPSNYNTLNNPFFVPYPNENGPTLAPTSTALPQHYNPYLQEIERKEELQQQQHQKNDQIQINLHHPKEQNQQQYLVEDFLQDNKAYLNDSEVPSDYGEENDSEDIDSSSYPSSRESQSHGSSHVKSGKISEELKSSSRTQGDKGYPFTEINKIINDSKQNNEILTYLNENKQYIKNTQQDLSASKFEDSGSSIYESSIISDKYLNSNCDQSHQLDGKQSVTTSYLADEFLGESAQKSDYKSSNNYSNSGLGSSNIGGQSGKKSYLKSLNTINSDEASLKKSLNNNEMLYSQLTNNKVFDYNDYGKQSHKPGSTLAKMELGMTPQSELSYSYSEMVGDMEASNNMSSKMRMSGGSYLKNQNQTLGQSMGNRFLQTQTNQTIQEEDDDKNTSKTSSYCQSSQKQMSQKVQSNLTPSFQSQQIATNNIKQGGIKLDIANDDNGQPNATGTLADAFRIKKQQILLNKQQDDSTEYLSKKEGKQEKTKQELAEIRKQMMKQRPKTSYTNQSISISDQQRKNDQSQNDKFPNQLMSRLAKGEKAEVSKKEMLKLTSKNYELLPEVKKKKEDEKKKEELKERMKQVKEIEKQRRELMMRQKK